MEHLQLRERREKEDENYTMSSSNDTVSYLSKTMTYIIVRHDRRHDSCKHGIPMKVECDLPLTGDDLKGEGAELCVYCWLGRSGVFPLLETLLLKNIQSRAGKLDNDSIQ
jgi:hypothetical protein